ncbi:MAG: DUF4388 domain-containing protein [Vicinamibacteria bacterium]
MDELRGLLAVGVLPEIFRRIFLGRRSGILHLAIGVDRSDFVFSGGYLTRAVTTAPGARLGDLLVQIGFLAASDRDACLEIAALSEERVGETLLRLGLLKDDQLSQGLALQLREVLVRALTARGGVYTFAEVEGKAADFGGFHGPRLDPREVLLDATWTLIGDQAIDDLVGDVTRKLRTSDDHRLLAQDFRMAESDALLLGQVQADITAEKLLSLSSLSVDEARASLAGLLVIGALEFVGAPPPTAVTIGEARLEAMRLSGRLGASDPYEVLGVEPDASADEVRSTYLRLLRACDPATSADPEFQSILHRMSKQVAAAFLEIERRRSVRQEVESPPEPPAVPATLPKPAAAPTQALPKPDAPERPAPAVGKGTTSAILAPKAPPTLPPAFAASGGTVSGSDVTGPIWTVPRPSKPVAAPAPMMDPAASLDAASEAVDAGLYHEALALLHDATPHLTGRIRGAALVRKARILLIVENGTRLAQAELKAALSEDPGNAEAHEVLGTIYEAGGSPALATMEYRKTLDLQPRNAVARAGLQKLTGPKPEKPQARKGLFGL